MKQIITAIVVLLLPGLLSAAEPQILKLKIEGMTCGMCEAKVKKQLSSVCVTSSADSKKGEGTCVPKAGVTPEQILQEANKTGFKTSKLN